MSTKCFSVDFAERDLTEKEKETSVLHCWITITTKNKIAKYHENIKPEGSFIGALFRKSNTCPNQGLFISVALTKQLDSFEYIDQDPNDNKICLEASTHFFKHYAIPRHCRDLFFKPVFCLPLERVILGVKSDSSYRRSTSSEWKDHLTVLASTRKLLCRNKDYLMPRVDFEHNELAKDFFTVDCSPVNQGYISVHTEIIVIKLNNDHKKPNTESYLELINYMLKNSLLPHGFKDAILPITPKLKEFLDSKTSHELKMVVAKSLPQSSYDIHNSLFAHNYVLENKKLKNGDWVEVSVRHQGKELADITNHRLARIFTLPPHSSSDAQAVFVSPQFRLNAHSETFSLLETNNVMNTLHLDKAAKNPEYADECHLALVQSPHYNATLVIDDLKENYFSIPRYVKVGDVIALPSTDNVAFHQQLDDRNEFRWPVIYLKASKIIPHWGDYKKDRGYLVDNQNSKIYVLGTVKSYIPVTMETFLSLTPTHPFLSDAEPAGLRSYLEKLHSLVFPLLEHWFENKMVNCNVLLTGPIGCGKSVVVKALCRCLNLHLYVVNCHDLFIDPTVDRIKSALNLAQTLAPCIMLLKNGDCVGRERESVEKDPKVVQAFCQTMKTLNTDTTFPIVTIATSSQLHSINAKVNSVFLHHIQMEVPTEKERFEILESLFSTTTLYSDVSLAYVAQRTAGLVLSDLNVVATLGAKAAYWRMKDTISKLEHSLTQREMEDVCRAGIPICQQDLIVALEEVNSSQAQAIGALKIPNVKWDDVGGLLDVKNEIIDTIQLPLQHPELLLSGLRRSGVLLYGPPGTGKTLLAKAVATECSLNFLSVKGPELINMYVGQSEQNVREIFGRARSAAPCIIFFDEIDSLAPNRGRSGDSGGVMDRLVSQLLAEMDGLNKSADVFVIGATNRPDLLDPALLRPGRFDRLLYVGIAEDRESRMKILSALTRKFPMSDDVDLELVEAKCPPHLTGADFYALCSGAYMNSIRRNIVNLEKGEITKPETEVNQDDFMFALKTLTPSVSEKELLRFQSIHASLSA